MNDGEFVSFEVAAAILNNRPASPFLVICWIGNESFPRGTQWFPSIRELIESARLTSEIGCKQRWLVCESPTGNDDGREVVGILLGAGGCPPGGVVRTYRATGWPATPTDEYGNGWYECPHCGCTRQSEACGHCGSQFDF